MYNRAFNCLCWSCDRSLGDTQRLLATHVIYHSFNLYPNHYLQATNVHFSCHFCTDRRGEKKRGMGGVEWGCELKNQIALHCLLLSSLHCLNLGEKGNAVMWKKKKHNLVFKYLYHSDAFGRYFHHERWIWSLSCIMQIRVLCQNNTSTSELKSTDLIVC